MTTGNAKDPEPPVAPPRLLSRPAEPKPVPPPVHDADALAAVRRRWAQISAASGGVRAKVKGRVAAAAAGVRAQDRAMTGELVGALDALARRMDELTTRLCDLESLLQEVVELTSEELARVQVAFGAAREDPEHGGPRGG